MNNLYYTYIIGRDGLSKTIVTASKEANICKWNFYKFIKHVLIAFRV